MVTSGEVSESVGGGTFTQRWGEGQGEPHNPSTSKRYFPHPLPLSGRKGGKENNPCLSILRGKEGLSSLSEERGEGGVGAVLGQPRSVLVPARNDGNSVH